jgi:hypothetical protein
MVDRAKGRGEEDAQRSTCANDNDEKKDKTKTETVLVFLAPPEVQPGSDR